MDAVKAYLSDKQKFIKSTQPLLKIKSHKLIQTCKKPNKRINIKIT
jgi:hypothetical protein